MKRLAVVGLWMVPAVALAVTPSSGGSVLSGTGVVINNSTGDQTDPHVSGDLAAYTDVPSNQIRYYRFSTSADSAIPLGTALFDVLSDVSGNLVAFSRVELDRNAIMVFDTTTANLVEIAPQAGSNRMGAALNGNRVAFIDMGAGNGDVYAYDLTTSTLSVVSADPAAEQNPNVAPTGNAIVWEQCPTSISNCNVFKGIFSGGAWSVSAVANTAEPEGNPDTDGVTIAYDATYAASATGQDIYFTPIGGGAVSQLQIAGSQQNPSISDGVIAFESRATSSSPADLFVYVIATNTVYQVTNTPTIDENLNDISSLGSNQFRMVWAANDGAAGDENIHGMTFSLPAATTNMCLNRTAALTASRSTPPTTWSDASQSFSTPFSFALPASMAVTQGNASNKHLTLSWTNSCGEELKCHYHGAAGGSQYVFDHCMGSASGLSAGSIVTVSNVSLHVDDASNSAHTTTVSVTLAEACGTTAPSCGGGDDGDHHSTGGHVCNSQHGDEGHSDEELSTDPQPMGCSATGAMLPMILAALALLLAPRRATARSTRRSR
jgi:hypothetical protein